MVRRATSMGVAIAITIASGAACDDFEQRALRVGREAQAHAAARCEGEAVEAFDACLRTACRGPCASFEGSESFFDTCVEACQERGVCATDADCRAPHVCVAIAPRVRRCSAAAPAPSAR